MTYRHLPFILALLVACSYSTSDAAHHKMSEQKSESDADKQKTVTISDANLRAVIADSLNKASDAAITAADMATLTVLRAPNSAISDLTGLEHATNLRILNLGDVSENDRFVNSNQIEDISVLSGLTDLRTLNLTRTMVSDISVLSDLTKLRTLNLSINREISDISPLSGLTNLRTLNLFTNKISDISPLSGLTNLRTLNLSRNKISDISPLSGLTELKILTLRDCSISDISPLVANTGLGDSDNVDLRRNPLSETSINTHIPALKSRGITLKFDN